MRRWIAAFACLTLFAGCEAETSGPSTGGEPVPEGCPETDGPFARGSVLVPDLRASPDAGGEVRREVPAREVAVIVEDGGEPLETETDANGRWCIDIGERETGMDLVATATIDGAELRRPIITREGQIISVRTEAVLQVLSERVGDLSSVPPAVFLNLEAIASTATDLLQPIDWRGGKSVEAVVEKVVARIAEDPRFSETLERLE